jgi:uncharacterized protein YdeI (YjbR/CyaY-like superfamily)
VTAKRDVGSALRLRSRASWRKWLTKNHGSKREALLIIYKRAPKNARFSSRDALEEALCFGWIDGWFKPLDDERWVIRYTPRRKGSNWSPYNIASVWKLLNQGLMTSAGTVKLPADALEVWKKHRPNVTIVTNRVGAQGRKIMFSDGKNYLSLIKIPARAP